MVDSSAPAAADRRKLAWGILGTGRIAKSFAGALAASRTGRLVAVGSRSAESVAAFADEFAAPRRHASYEALLADPEVEAVYIALPNHLHALWTVRCAEAGKHILCEKPLATNAAEAMVAVEAARANDVFLMEAFMYRCHPQTARLVELIRERVIGDVRVIQAQFSFNMRGAHPENIRQQNAAAGGGIMDVGCYTASVARLIAGAALGQAFADPVDVQAVGQIGEGSRVDEWSTAVCRFPGGIVASLTCGIQASVDSTLRIWGSEGHIAVPQPWFPGQEGNRILVQRDGQKEPEEVVVGAAVPLYAVEADTVAAHLADRQAPSPCMTWADSLGNMRTLDRWRRDIGLSFDNEQPAALATPLAGRRFARRPTVEMPTGRVAGVDKPISRVALGSMVFGEGLPLTCALLDYYYEQGGNCIDTAFVYRTEAMVGHWLRLRGVRDEMVLIAKGAHTPDCYPALLSHQLYQTLEQLGTDYVDLYFMHRDNPAVPVGEFVDALNEHHRAGRIRAFGGSNWSIERLQAANDYARARGLTGFAAASPNYALATWNEPMWKGCVAATDPASRRWYAETKTALFAWSSQASGFFTGRYRPEDRANPAVADIARTWFNDENFRRLERARHLAAERGATSTDVALAYVLSQPLDIFALIGPRTVEEARTSLAALALTLTPEELRWLEGGE